MALINRITRLFRTDMHAVLDRLEEPELMLRQAVREMEEAIATERRQLQLLEQEQAQLAKHDASLTDSLARITHEIDVCLDADNDELARKCLRRKLQTDKLIEQSTRRIDAVSERISTARETLNEHEEQLASMQQKASLFTREPTTDVPEVDGSTITDADVEVALLHEKQRRAS